MQVARIGIEHAHLTPAGPYDRRVLVPHVRDVVDAVQVFPPQRVVEVGATATHDVNGLVVGETQVGAEHVLPALLETDGLDVGRLSR